MGGALGVIGFVVLKLAIGIGGGQTPTKVRRKSPEREPRVAAKSSPEEEEERDPATGESEEPRDVAPSAALSPEGAQPGGSRSPQPDYVEQLTRSLVGQRVGREGIELRLAGKRLQRAELRELERRYEPFYRPLAEVILKVMKRIQAHCQEHGGQLKTYRAAMDPVIAEWVEEVEQGQKPEEDELFRRVIEAVGK